MGEISKILRTIKLLDIKSVKREWQIKNVVITICGYFYDKRLRKEVFALKNSLIGRTDRLWCETEEIEKKK